MNTIGIQDWLFEIRVSCGAKSLNRLTSIEKDCIVTNSNANVDVKDIGACCILTFKCLQAMSNGCQHQIDVVKITEI